MKLQTLLLIAIAVLLAMNLIYSVRPVLAQGTTTTVYVTLLGTSPSQVVRGSVIGFSCPSAGSGCLILSQ